MSLNPKHLIMIAATVAPAVKSCHVDPKGPEHEKEFDDTTRQNVVGQVTRATLDEKGLTVLSVKDIKSGKVMEIRCRDANNYVNHPPAYVNVRLAQLPLDLNENPQTPLDGIYDAESVALVPNANAARHAPAQDSTVFYHEEVARLQKEVDSLKKGTVEHQGTVAQKQRETAR